MIEGPREFARLRNAVLLLTVIAWMLLLVEPAGIGLPAHCSGMEIKE